MTFKLKLCKDCVYCVPDETFENADRRLEFAKCNRKRKLETSRITGKSMVGGPLPYCSVERSYWFFGLLGCGKHAKFFKSKDTRSILRTIVLPSAQTNK